MIHLMMMRVKKDLKRFVKGDRIHRDGLRVLLFATENSLRILSRARTILGDGTFRICPSLWYQVFIISEEIRDKLIKPVAFSILQDIKWFAK